MQSLAMVCIHTPDVLSSTSDFECCKGCYTVTSHSEVPCVTCLLWPAQVTLPNCSVGVLPEHARRDVQLCAGRSAVSAEAGVTAAQFAST